jgi:hypothetical protein
MKVPYLLVVLVGIAVLFAVSCQTPPTPEEDTVPEKTESPVPEKTDPNSAPPDQAALDDLNAAIARAQKSRQQAIDIESPSYFADDWEAAESQYVSAVDQEKKSTLGEVKDSVARYNAVADAFDTLARKCLPLYARDRENEIVRLRAAAIDADAYITAPDYLVIADHISLRAQSQYDAEEYYPAAASAFLAADMYRALKTGLDAYNVREEIVDRNFIIYDPGSFEKADDTITAAAFAYEGENASQAQDKADEALLRYNLVLKTGKQSFAADRGAAAGMERQAALELKANVAVRREFEAASVIYNQAEASFKAEDYDKAADLYGRSESMFDGIRQTAEEKRRLATEARISAESKMAESDEAARKAELFLEGDVR